MAMADIVMEEPSVEEQEPAPLEKPLVSGFNILQTRQHYDRVLTEVEEEEEQAPAPVEEPPLSAF